MSSRIAWMRWKRQESCHLNQPEDKGIKKQRVSMKYGESVFDILYLLFAIISGCLTLGA